MRVLVCGGRDYAKVKELNAFLAQFHVEHPITEVIHGAARGADTLAGLWANMYGVVQTPVPAEWKIYGKAAGRLRNQRMLDMKPDCVVAFPGGNGTRHMVSIAKEAGVPVILVAAI